jgi:hypothetical protein
MSEREDVVETVAVETVAVTTPAGVEPAGGGTQDLGKVRELVLKAHPDVVPDLVRGGSVDELIASVEPARSAYQRVADQVRGSSVRGSSAETTVTAEPGATVNAEGSTTVVVQPPVVPAGGASNVVDPAELAPTTKIAQALAARKRK